jgi:hypothetical protein
MCGLLFASRSLVDSDLVLCVWAHHNHKKTFAQQYGLRPECMTLVGADVVWGETNSCQTTEIGMIVRRRGFLQRLDPWQCIVTSIF